ncbi:MAG TPA: hemerythrin domain-containing protein [Kofleriaceae bacterium]|nr:hemerythrin domain-containing protein [Kofleriaceae bacterium]
MEPLFRQIEAAATAGEPARARELFHTLSTRLIACMRAEHSIVYPKFAFAANLGDEVREASREHDRIERAINQIRIAPLSDEDWLTAVRQLERSVAEHAQSEEWVLFPIASLALSHEELRGLGEEFQRYQAIAASVAGASITYDIVVALAA